jgi:hypothetical protein
LTGGSPASPVTCRTSTSHFSLLSFPRVNTKPTTPSRVSTTCARIDEIRANKCSLFRPSHPLLLSTSLHLSPLSISGHQRSNLAAARQLYAFIDNSILTLQISHLLFYFIFYTFFYTLRTALPYCNSRVHLSRTSPRGLGLLSRDALCIQG